MATRRRVGAETSKTRDTLLDRVERLMIDGGYAAVSYRAVATAAGVTAGLVQYYFPTLDDLFLATIRRRADQHLARLTAALQERADEPLRVVWEYSREEATAAFMTEFTALGNHRKSIRAEIAAVTERVRRTQLDAVAAAAATRPAALGLPTDALLFLLASIPKMIMLEEGIGVATSHAALLDAVERHLDTVEPGPSRNAAAPGLPSPGRPVAPAAHP